MTKFSHLIILTAVTILTLMACGCSHKDKPARISGTIQGKPTMNLRYTYITPGGLLQGVTAARNGDFGFAVELENPVVVEIFDNDFHLLGRLLTDKNEEAECNLDPTNPYKSTFKGKLSDTQQRWQQVNNENAEAFDNADTEKACTIIEKYVKEHPDDMVSTLLLVYTYDSARHPDTAAALLELITPQARPAWLTEAFAFSLGNATFEKDPQPVMPMNYIGHGGHLTRFRTDSARLSLIAFTNRETRLRDSIVPALRRSAALKGVQVLELSLDQDTITWHNAVRADSATWRQGWVAGSIGAPSVSHLHVSTIPYFIVADSAGHQLYRGVDITEAQKLLSGKAAAQARL
ncbi:MAG: hypothetical protein K2M79_02890 [Muribaculaceae bacterium]|nr:hypothetical protein [Muribaculaceae bacterium]